MTRQFFARMAAAVMIVAAGLLGTVATAQNRAISGKVVDANGAPVVGAAVVVVGNASIGAVTDANGTFRLNVPAGANINISCIGYADQTFSTVNQSVFNVTLEEDTEFLEETVVIGYGVQRKSDLTGAVASVRAEDLQNRSVTDAAAALQGKTSGVQIINSSGAPGAGADIRVRGYSSNSGNIGPLLIVDGLKVDNIQYLDPSMIESMEILKDAASAAIYGAQAGNGVVLITTKTGKEGTAHITYNGRFTLQSLGKKADIFRAQEYIDYQKYIGNISDETLKTNNYDGTDTDWYDAVFQPSWSKQNGITFQGGNNRGHFFTSLNYVDNDGIVVGKKDVYHRLTAQVNADYSLFKWFNISTNNSIEKWDRKSVSNGYGSVLNSVVSIDPLTPPYISNLKDTPGGMQEHYAAGDPIPTDPNHNNDYYGTSKYLEEATGNPLFQRDKTQSTSGGINIRGSLAANFLPFKGMTITSRFGYRINQSSSHNYTPPYWLTAMANSANHSIDAGVNTGYYYQWENFANYNRTFGKHNVGAMVGMSYTESHSDNASLSASGPNPLKGYEPNFLYMDYVNPIESTTRGYGNAPGMSAQLSYFGRLMYTFDNRYSIQGNFRADAYDSSKLSKQARWGFFPSVSAGWTISNEPFFRDNISRDAVSFLKFRASWGRNGNINVLNNYPYATSVSYNSSNYEFGPDAPKSYGSRPSGLANPNLKWETSEQIDLGLDARFFGDRLSLGLDWYNKDTKDLLVSINPVPELGVSSTTVNGGRVNNKGFEVELGWKDSIGEFGYSINANFSTVKNNVVELDPSISRILYGSYYVSQLRTAFEAGYPIWYMYGYQFDGIDSEGNAILHDFNEDGNIGDEDKTFIGKGIPDYTYGVTVSFDWKGLDFVLFGTGVGGNDIFPILYRTDRPYNNTLDYYRVNSWSASNKNALFPDPASVKNSTTFWASSANVFDGSYFKIKQMQLGYTLPANLTKKVLINRLRMYVSLDDFFTFTSYPGLDPETATTTNAQQMGVDLGSYPTTKKLVFGVNVTF